MTEYTEQEFNLSKENVVNLCDRIKTFLLKDFDKKLLQHKKLDHKWFIQGTIHSLCKTLGKTLDKQVAIYLILGSNPRRPGWGDIKTKYNIEPLKFDLRKEVVLQGRKLIPDHVFKLFLTDINRNGDFHMKVSFCPYREYKITITESSVVQQPHSEVILSKISEFGSKIKLSEKGAKFEKMVTVLADSSDEDF
jgi:hypothetical protein